MRVAKRRAGVVAVLVCLWTGLSWGQTLRVVGFNVESGGARPSEVIMSRRLHQRTRNLEGT